MPVGLTCPQCGAAISEASVVAAAPVCTHCRVVITGVGGTLGFTSAYGLSDPSITRRRVEKDLEVIHEYQVRYRGMIEACKQQLSWGVERYAKLPPPPELLKLRDVPSFWRGVDDAMEDGVGPIGFVWFWFWLAPKIVTRILEDFLGFRDATIPTKALIPYYWLYTFVVAAFFLTRKLYGHFAAKISNGRGPAENARRLKLYEEARAAALRAAEPLKAAEDHRLRCQIRDLEGSIKTVSEMEEEVSRILRKLR